MTAANVKIFNTEEVQNFINLLSGLEQEGGNPRIKQIIHRVVSDLFKTIEDLEITSENWHFLTGDKEYIYKIANKGFNMYAAENSKVNGGFEHSGLFALIDKEGNIRCRKDKFGNPILYYDGLEQAGIDAIKEDIKLLLEE